MPRGVGISAGQSLNHDILSTYLRRGSDWNARCKRFKVIAGWTMWILLKGGRTKTYAIAHVGFPAEVRNGNHHVLI